MTKRISELCDMLRTRRPASSRSEKRWIRQWIDSLDNVRIDARGNRLVRIGTAPILWSCHTDTVHRQGGQQELVISDGQLSTISPTSNCLGADDGVGAWLMRQMILARIEGFYVFHRAEEIGGLGSQHIALATPEILESIDYAIAWDRAGKRDIITHQGWTDGRCCSDEFAYSLESALQLGLAPDPTGVFTDTAHYRDLVPECTNVSVGYLAQHSRAECLDLNYCERLLDAVLSADFTRLEVQRDPSIPEPTRGDCHIWNYWRGMGIVTDYNPDFPTDPWDDDDAGTAYEHLQEQACEMCGKETQNVEFDMSLCFACVADLREEGILT